MPKDGKCTPGKSYRLDCNTCVCNPKGEISACTLIACPHHADDQTSDDLPELPEDGTCTPGKSYKQDCNTCMCGADGQPACTYKLCHPSKRSANQHGQPALPVPQDGSCIPGRTYKLDCNTCTCNDNGRITACTQMACVRRKRNANNIGTRYYFVIVVKHMLQIVSASRRLARATG